MRILTHLFFIVLFTATLYGCATPKAATEPLVAPGDLASEELMTTERFRKYESVGIRPFSTEGVVYLSTNADERPEMDSFKGQAPHFLTQGFVNEMKGNFYKRYGIIQDDEDAKNYDLVIEGRFMELDRGNAAGRFWGVGGATRASVDGAMTETATGKVVVKFRDTKIGTGSLGSMVLLQNNCNEIGGNISDFLEEVY